jgi:putative addiction module component (TIGR02574 family)
MAIESDLVERTMHLSSADRAELARRLILSLEPGGVEADVERAWEIEIERRIRSFEGGQTAAADWQDTVERAKAKLNDNAR